MEGGEQVLFYEPREKRLVRQVQQEGRARDEGREDVAGKAVTTA